MALELVYILAQFGIKTEVSIRPKLTAALKLHRAAVLGNGGSAAPPFLAGNADLAVECDTAA